MSVSPHRLPVPVAEIFIKHEKSHWLLARRYLAALLAPAIVAAVMQLTWPFLQTNPVQPFMLAVIFCAWYGGLGPGLLSAGLSFLISDFFFMEPYFAFRLSPNVDLVRLALFGIVGIVISVISEATNRSQSRDAANIQLATSSEAAIKASEDHLRRVLNNLFAFVAVLLPDGTLIEANRSPLEAAGISFADVEGKKVWDCYWLNYDPEVQRRVRAACERAARGETLRFDLVVRMAGGVLMPIDFMLAPMRNDAGEITHLIPSAIDITERKKAEHALTESETRLRAILDAEPECVKLLAADGSLIDMNPAGLAMIEADSLAQVQGANVCDLTLPAHRQDFMEANRRVFAGESVILEFEISGIRGTRRWLEMHATPLRDRNQNIIAALGITRDVTERRLAEQALREAQEQLESALAAGSVGTWVWDLVNNRAFADEYLSELFSIKRDSQAEGGVLDIFLQAIDETDRPRVQDAIERTIKFDEKYDIEFRVLPLDKNPHWLHGRGRIERDADGNALRFLGMLMDITDRKRAEEALRESEDSYRTLVESASDGIMVSDPDGHLLDVNAVACRMFGYTRAELLTMRNTEIITDDEVARVAPEMMRLNGGEVVRSEWECRRKDGTVFLCEASATVLPNGRVLAILRDVTERKQAEKALQASENRFRALIENSHDAIALFGPDGQVLYTSPATEKIVGYLPEEVHERGMFEFIRPDCQDAVKERLAESLRRPGVGIPTESFVRHKDGRWRFLEGVLTNLLHDPDVGAIVNNYRDVTERKQAEEAVRAKNEELAGMTQQLWQASKLATMGELSASIAHELNNPLTTVTLSVETLMSHLNGDEDTRSLLGMVRSESERMANMVSNLLIFSRRSHAQISTLNIADEVDRSLDLIRAHLKGRNVNLVKEACAELPTVQGDRQQLLQVFLNLLTNATDAMPQGGTLTVGVRLDSLNDQPAVLIEFADTGTGIDPEGLDSIWEPFVTTKPEGKGTGLGLPICRRTVEEHGGAITINSKVGLGTTVTIRLPATTVLLAQ